MPHARPFWSCALLLMLMVVPTGRVVAAPAGSATPGNSAAARDVSSQAAAIVDDYESAQQRFMEEWQTAPTDAERQKIAAAKMPDRDAYAHRALDLARSHPADPGAVDAAAAALQLSGGTDFKLKSDVLDLLAAHLNDERLAKTFQWLLDWPGKKTEAFFDNVLHNSTSRSVRGQALMAWAAYSRQKSRWGERFKQQPGMRQAMEKQYDRDLIDALPENVEKPLTQAKALYRRVIAEYGDVEGPNGPLGEQAKNVLYAFDHLAVGNTAPDITGPTIDGKSMKLSAYRGKVVVLDFWGDW